MDYKMKKKLDYTLPLDVMAYKPYDAAYTGILLSFQDSLCELYTNFMHFNIRKVSNEKNFHIEGSLDGDFSCLSVNKIPWDLINVSEITEFVMQSIDKNYYVILPVETMFIHNYINYNLHRNCHPLLLFGYDTSKKVFTSADFFNYSASHFTVQEVSFADVNAAFNDIRAIKKMNDPAVLYEEWRRNVELIKKVSGYAYRMTPKKLIQDINFYLNGQSMTGQRGWIAGVYYGMDIYPLIEEYLLYLVNNGQKVDTRIFSLLFYHYRFMQKQITFIQSLTTENSCQHTSVLDLNSIINTASDPVYFKAEYKSLENKANIDIYLAIKYNLNLQIALLNKIRKHVKEYHSREKNVLILYRQYLQELAPNKCKDFSNKEKNVQYM